MPQDIWQIVILQYWEMTPRALLISWPSRLISCNPAPSQDCGSLCLFFDLGCLTCDCYKFQFGFRLAVYLLPISSNCMLMQCYLSFTVLGRRYTWSNVPAFAHYIGSCTYFWESLNVWNYNTATPPDFGADLVRFLVDSLFPFVHPILCTQ
jgi:hypothetical protein